MDVPSLYYAIKFRRMVFRLKRKCLMQGSRLLMQAAPAFSCPPTRESILLQQSIQSQFDEQIARIFDESLYADLELGTGRFELKTHTCILKTRAPYFYEKIEELLKVNFNKKLYDEVYSFVSDIYTDCDLEVQEKVLVVRLERIIAKHNRVPKQKKKKSTKLTSLHLDASPSIETNKDYYALVQVDNNSVDIEIDEQNYLSSAFQAISKSQPSVDETIPLQSSYNSSHSSKNIAHSTDCDNKLLKIYNLSSVQNTKDLALSSHIPVKTSESFSIEENSISTNEFQSNFSPDSLITDDPNSASEYCFMSNDFSECYTNTSVPNMNYSRNLNTMDNVSDSIDSGVENTGIFEDLTDSKEISLQLSDLSIMHGSAIDIPNNDKCQNNLQPNSRNVVPPQHLLLPNSSKSFKEQKQLRNEEVTVLESSSLSSETGSWESVFPQKGVAKNRDVLPKNNSNLGHDTKITIQYSPVSKTFDIDPDRFANVVATKSTVCFIDAASLVDDDDQIKNKIEIKARPINIDYQRVPAPSEPLPCSTIKQDLSPNDGSESHENDDSLEQPDAKDADSLQNDISPTIFDLALTTDVTYDNDDNLVTNPFDEASNSKATTSQEAKCDENFPKSKTFSTNSVFLSTTPHNSILSLQCISKGNDSEDCDSDSTVTSHDAHRSFRKISKFADSSPIVSGGASIEDHLPQKSGYLSSPLAKQILDNKPIVSGSYTMPEAKPTAQSLVRSGASSSWVVDMSKENIALAKDTNSVKGSSEFIRPKNKNAICHSNVSSEKGFDSDSSDRSNEKFYIDLSSLPEPTIKETTSSANQKKNIFSMYIDLTDETTTPKERPAKLSSTVTIKNKLEPAVHSNKSRATKAEPSNIAAQPDASFENYEELCKNPDMSISEILTISDSSNKSETTFKIDETKNIASNQQKAKEDKNFNDASVMSESFVRLSDLDKPTVAIVDLTKRVKAQDPNVRMTRSIPNTLWDEHKGARPSEVISSFHSENTMSLNRLFPHLKNEFSKSMPGSLSSRTRSPFRIAEHPETASEISGPSSMQSSCRSVVENSTTTDDSQSMNSSLMKNCQSKLGQDLLRMFLEEIATDVIVEVNGRRFKAHKCILSSRCQFFAGFLSGGWVESAGNVIILPPFSYTVVHFALCHIYSGLATIPDSVSIVELASLADMLGLEGLKEAISFSLKSRYCHHFHEPCCVCIAGVVECFPLTSVYGLDDLYRKCLNWITKYFHRVWPTKAFSALPKELVDKCYQHHVVEMNTDNVVDTVCLAGMTEAALSSARWAEVCRTACRRLLRTATHYAAARLCAVLAQIAPLPPVLPPSAASALNACIVGAIQMAPLEEIDRSRNFLLNALKAVSNSKPDIISSGDRGSRFERNSFLLLHASDWLAICLRNAERAAPRFKDLQTAKMIREQALRSLSQRTASGKQQTHQCNVNIDHVRACFVPYATKPTAHEPQQVTPRKKAAPKDPPQIRTTKAQEERAKFNAALNTRERESNHRKGKGKSKNAQAKAAAAGAPARLKASNSDSSRGPSPVALRTQNCQVEPRKCQVEPRNHSPLTQSNKAPEVPTNKAPDVPVQTNKTPVVPVQTNKTSVVPAQANKTSVVPAQTNQAPVVPAQTNKAPVVPAQTNKAPVVPVQTNKAPDVPVLINDNVYATYTKNKRNPQTKKRNENASEESKKWKTKIPVYQNDKKRTQSLNNKKVDTKASPLTSSMPSTKAEKQNAGSLHNATKSSQAKQLPRNKKALNAKQALKQKAKQEKLPTIPVMERSGTFLKDEPTFGDITTNTDIGQRSLDNNDAGNVPQI